jgi:chromosome segregation ATPase
MNTIGRGPTTQIIELEARVKELRSDLIRVTDQRDRALTELEQVEDMVTDHLKTGHPVTDIANRLIELASERDTAEDETERLRGIANEYHARALEAEFKVGVAFRAGWSIGLDSDERMTSSDAEWESYQRMKGIDGEKFDSV